MSLSYPYSSVISNDIKDGEESEVLTSSMEGCCQASENLSSNSNASCDEFIVG